MRQHFLPLMALAAVSVSLASCSSDEPAANLNDTPIPADKTRLFINPQTVKTSRSHPMATTANIDNLDVIITYTSPTAGVAKYRWDKNTGYVYSTATGAVGTSYIDVPRNSQFTVTCVGVAEAGSPDKTVGGVIDCMPNAAATTTLSGGSGATKNLVRDYVYGVSTSQTANKDVLNVPVTLAHQTCKITFSAEVNATADYLVAMDPRVVMTGGKTDFTVNNTTGVFSASGQDDATQFYLKPFTTSYVDASELTSACGDFRTSLSGETNLIYLTNKDGRKTLNFGDSDDPFSMTKWGSLENARQTFWWPGSYAATTSPFFSGSTFSGGFSVILNYRAWHLVYSNGKGHWDGIPFVKEKAAHSVGTSTAPIELGSYYVVIPVDLTSASGKNLEGGKAYNFHIKFFDPDRVAPGPGIDDQDAELTKVSITPTVTDWTGGNEHVIPEPTN